MIPKNADRLYVVVLDSLAPGPVAAQAVHGALEFAAAHPATWAEWRERSNTVAILAANAERLASIRHDADVWDVRHATFNEPDMGGALTAVAMEPGRATKRMCAGLPCAG